MRNYRLSVSLITSFAMIYSPIASAAVSSQQKQQMNSVIQEFQKSKFIELYNRYGNLMDGSSQGHIESVLKEIGSQKLDSLQVNPIKGQKKGEELYRAVLTLNGASLTMTLNPSNPETVDINGEKFGAWELQNLETIARRLAKKNANLSASATVLSKDKTGKSTAAEETKAFLAMSPEKKVEYLMLMRQVRESSEKVLSLQESRTAQLESSQNYALSPLFWSVVAEANAPKVGVKCGVAGNLSIYENGPYTNSSGKKIKGIHCAAFPQSRLDFKPLPTFSDLCEHTGKNAGKGTLIACPPLLYGGAIRADGNVTPHCQPIDAPDFTQNATVNCSKMSPLRGEPGSPERIEDSRKILEAYARLRSKADGADIAACFNDRNQIEATDKCYNIFAPIFEEHNEYKETALKECVPSDLKQKTKDQKFFCEELQKRTLSLDWFMKVEWNLTDKEDSACKAAGGSLVGKGISVKSCICNDGRPTGKELGGAYRKCGLAPVEDRSTAYQPDKCELPENKDLKECKKDEISWLPLLGFGALFAWLLFRNRGNAGTVTPPPNNCGNLSHYLCTPWLTEGNNGQTGSQNNGGVRGNGSQVPAPNIGIPAQPTGTGTK